MATDVFADFSKACRAELNMLRVTASMRLEMLIEVFSKVKHRHYDASNVDLTTDYLLNFAKHNSTPRSHAAT
jgi:hypothetical protein